MKEKETKEEWKDPDITVLSINEDTEGGINGSSDGLDVGS